MCITIHFQAIPTCGVDAYLLMYCIDNHYSYEEVIHSLKELQKVQTFAAVILVANKVNMECHRKVKQDGSVSVILAFVHCSGSLNIISIALVALKPYTERIGKFE